MHNIDVTWFCCDKCQFKSKECSALKRHLVRKHDINDAWFSCNKCKFKSKRFISLRRHLAQVHDFNAKKFSYHMCENPDPRATSTFARIKKWLDGPSVCTWGPNQPCSVTPTSLCISAWIARLFSFCMYMLCVQTNLRSRYRSLYSRRKRVVLPCITQQHIGSLRTQRHLMLIPCCINLHPTATHV